MRWRASTCSRCSLRARPVVAWRADTLRPECGVVEREGGIESVQLLGAVRGVGPGGAPVDLPSASQRRVLAILALYAPNPVRAEWLADLLDIAPGALRETTIAGHVEVRWSHGRFNGSPEAKVYLDTPLSATPGYFSLE